MLNANFDFILLFVNSHILYFNPISLCISNQIYILTFQEIKEIRCEATLVGIRG